MVGYLLWPIMRKYWKLMLSMMAVSALSVAMVAGMSSAYTTLERSLYSYVEDYRYADAVITTEVTDARDKEKLAGLSGVRKVDSRMVADVHVRTADGRPMTLRAFSYGVRDFQRFFVWAQDESGEYPNVAVDYKFAERNGIKAGDTLEVKIEDEYQTVCVGRIVSSVECLSIQRDLFSGGANADFGFIFLPEELLYGSELYGRSAQFLIHFDQWADGEAVLDAAEQELTGTEIVYSFLYHDSGVYKRIMNNLLPMKQLSLLAPVVFFANMLIVVSLFLTQVVRQCRKEIGILRALGFGQGEIRQLFSEITLVITLIGSVVGLIGGYFLMKMTSEIYGGFFPLPRLYYSVDWVFCGAGVVLTLLCGQLSAFFSTTSISSVMPSEAMSREAPTQTSVPAAVNRMLSVLPPAAKFSVTSMIRNHRRFWLTVICIGSSIMMILSAIMFNTSKDSMITDLFDDRIYYDCELFLEEKPDEEFFTKLNERQEVFDSQLTLHYQTELSFGDGKRTIVLDAVQPENPLVGIYDANRKVIEVPESGIVLDRRAAERLGAQVGDLVTLDGEVTVKVEAIADQSMHFISYISLKQAEQMVKEPSYGVVCRTSDEETLLRYAAELEGYSHADFTSLLREGGEETFAATTVGVNLLIGFAVLLGMIVVYNTTQTNLSEQKKEISVMRAIGFQVSDISRIWLIQSMTQFLFACIAGFSVGAVVARFTLSRMSNEDVWFPFVSSPGQYFLTAALVLGYVLISHMMAMGSVRKWDISENTKDKE